MCFLYFDQLFFLQTFDSYLPSAFWNVAGSAHGVPTLEANTIMWEADVFENAEHDGNLSRGVQEVPKQVRKLAIQNALSLLHWTCDLAKKKTHPIHASERKLALGLPQGFFFVTSRNVRSRREFSPWLVKCLRSCSLLLRTTTKGQPYGRLSDRLRQNRCTLLSRWKLFPLLEHALHAR